MIKELSKKEIKKTLDYIIENYSRNKNYKYWFNGDTNIPIAERAFLISDGSYYVDIDIVEGIHMFGILKLRDTTEPILSDMVELMNKCIKEYGVLACFRDVKHKRVKALWKYLERKCNVVTNEIRVDDIIVKIFYERM